MRLELGYGMNEKIGDCIKARPDVARSSTMSSTSSITQCLARPTREIMTHKIMFGIVKAK